MATNEPTKDTSYSRRDPDSHPSDVLFSRNDTHFEAGKLTPQTLYRPELAPELANPHVGEDEDDASFVLFGKTCFAEYYPNSKSSQPWEVRKYNDSKWWFSLSREKDVVELMRRLDESAK